MANITRLSNIYFEASFQDVSKGAIYPEAAPVTGEIVDSLGIVIQDENAYRSLTDATVWLLPVDALPAGEYTANLLSFGEVIATQSILIVNAPPEGATTRIRLLRTLAKRLHDGAEITASENTDSHTIKASLGLRKESGMVVGRQVVCLAALNSENVGFITEVIESTLGTTSVAVDPPFPSTIIAGDKFFLTAERGVGWAVEDYYQAINDAILMAQPYHAVPITTTITVPQSDSVRSLIRLTLPPKWTHFSHMEIYNEGPGRYTPGTSRGGASPGWSVEGWVRVPMSDEPGRDGERLVPHSATIEVTGSYARMFDQGSTVRLTGYRRADELRNDYDWTTIAFEWLVYQAAAVLLFSGIRTDQNRERMAAFMQKAADGSRGVIGTGIIPGTRMITRTGGA